MSLATYMRSYCGFDSPVPYEEEEAGANKVPISPWKFLYPVVVIIVMLLALLIVALPVGNPGVFYAFWCLWAAGIVTLMALPATSRASESSSGGVTVEPTPSPKETAHAC